MVLSYIIYDFLAKNGSVENLQVLSSRGAYVLFFLLSLGGLHHPGGTQTFKNYITKA